VREFETGATRDSAEDKLDYEGFLHPSVLKAFAEYMHYHRKQADGKLRSSDNWQKGIPQKEYMKSGYRHFMDWWTLHRRQVAGHVLSPVEQRRLEEALCALMFNVMGYLYEELRVVRPSAAQPSYATQVIQVQGVRATTRGDEMLSAYVKHWAEGDDPTAA